MVLSGVLAAGAAAFGFTDGALLPPDLYLSSPYTFQLSARSGCPPYYYEQQSGFFPPGVSMTRDGLISGTPQLGGTYQTWLAVKNQCPADSSERLFAFYVFDPNPFVVKTPSLRAGAKGAYYKVQLLSSEAGVLTWSLNAGVLPPGLQLTKGGAIMGLPTATGSFTFRVKVNDGRRTSTSVFTLAVGRRLGFATTRLPRATIGHPFRARLAVRGGVAPYRWQVLRGKPPRGVRFGSGVFAGTPRVAGRFPVTVRVWDANNGSITRTFVLVVHR